MILRSWTIKTLITGFFLFGLFLVLLIVPKTARADDSAIIDSGVATDSTAVIPPATTPDSTILAPTETVPSPDPTVSPGSIIDPTPSASSDTATSDPTVITSTDSGGSWSSSSTWVGGKIPGAGDTAIIATKGTDTVSLDSNVQVKNLTLNSGTLSSGTNTLSLAGDWTNLGGNFAPDQGTVVFNDASKTSHIAGNNTFNNLLCLTPGKTIIFEADSLTTVLGTLTIEGDSNNYVNLTSSVSSLDKMFGIDINAVSDAEGHPYLQYLDVSYSHAYGPVVPIPAHDYHIPGELNIDWDATITSTTTGGTWATGGTWVGGVAPAVGDNAVIATTGANSVTLGAAAQIVNITINSGATLAGSTFLLTVTGNYTNNGTHSGTGGVTVSGASSIIDGTGNTTNSGTFTISGATAPSFAATANITITGNLTMSGPVTITAGGIVTESGTTAISGAVTITNNGTFNANGASGITGSVAGSTWTQGANSTLNFKGSGAVFLATGTLNASNNGNTINYNFTGAQTVKATATYYHLTLSGSGIKTLTATTTAISGNLTLSGTATATTVVGLVISGNVSVGNGTTFTAAGFALTVTGTTTIGSGTSGNLTISSATGAKIFTGLVTINAGGTWNNSGNSAITFRGGITNNATFTAGSGVQTFDTNSQALNGTFSIPSITVTGAAVILTNNNTLTISTALSGTGGLTQAASATLNLGGTSGITTLNTTNNGNTVNYTGAAQTIHSNNYYNLGFSGSGAKTLQAGTTTISGDLLISGTATTTTVVGLAISGILSIGNGTTFTAAGFALTVTGTTTVGGGATGNLTISSATGAKTFVGLVTIAAGATWNNSGNSAVTFRGGITNNNTFTTGSGVQTFDTNSQALTGTFSMPSVTVTGVTLTNNGTLTVTTALAGTGGLTNAGTLNLNFTGALGISTLTANGSGTTVSYGAAGAQTVFSTDYWHLNLATSGLKTMQAGTTAIGGNLTISGSATMTGNAALVIAGAFNYSSSGSTTLTAATAIQVATWNQTAGTIVDNGNTITVTGTGANTWTETGTFSANGTVIFNGAAPQIGASIFNNLTISGAGGTNTGAISVASNLLISDGTTFTAAGYALTVIGTTTIGSGTSGNLTISSATGVKTFVDLVTINAGGTWNNSGNSAITFNGGITNSGTFTAGSGVQTFDTNDQALNGTFTIPSVTVTGVTLTNNDTLTVSTALSGTGELDQGANATLNLGGTSGITTLTAIAEGNTVNYTSNTAGQTIKVTIYVNLGINKPGQVATLGGATLVAGNLNIAAGTLDVDNLNNYPLNVNGDWTNNGTFLARQGLVTFAGATDQTIYDDNTWFGLAVTAAVARTVYFESGKTQTVGTNGLLAFQGAAGQLLTLAPKTGATPWSLTVDATVIQLISNMTVSYSDASGGAEITANDASNVDGGNNVHWLLPAPGGSSGSKLPPPPIAPPPSPPVQEIIVVVFHPIPVEVPPPAPVPTPEPFPFLPTALVTFFQQTGSFIAEQATQVYVVVAEAIGDGIDSSRTYLAGLGQSIANGFDASRTFIVGTSQTIAEGVSRPFIQGRGFFARLQLGLQKFYEIVFIQEPNHISNVATAPSFDPITGTASMTITWQTNHLSTSQINFGSAIGIYENTNYDQTQTRSHSITLNGLEPGKTYYYEVLSQNNQLAVDAFRSFTAPKN